MTNHKQHTKDGLLPCWYIKSEEIQQKRKNGQPFGELGTADYFRIVNRIDNTFIEGFMAREDKGYEYVNNVMERLSYLIDFLECKKVYFSFDRINVYELVELYPNHPNPVRFILKRLDSNKSLKLNQVFMIMPFHNKDLNDFYSLSIKPFLKEQLQMEIYRADDFRNNDIIIETIYKLIEESEIVIADTTMENKNAFYELGYAAAMGKEIVTIQDKNEQQKLFFDRAHIRTLFYDKTDLSSFHFDLKATIEGIKAKLG